MAINDKQLAFIDEYMINGHNASRAYKTAYPECKSGYNAHAARLIAKDNISAEINKRLDEIRKNMVLTRDAQHERLLAVVNSTEIDSVKVSALHELNDMLGYHRDKAPNAEREQAIRQKMTDEELVLHQEIARLRTQQESIRLAT